MQTRLMFLLVVVVHRKLSELAHEIGKDELFRQKYAAGFNCCCCTWVWHCVTIPDYLRSWDL